MSKWKFLNRHRITPEQNPVYGSYPSDGFNGMFECRLHGVRVRIIASDGLGWEHVSVSILNSKITPDWSIMCEVKSLFWDNEQTVMQLHPPKSSYVNFHPGCLHLWRPTDPGVEIPLPDSILVGPK